MTDDTTDDATAQDERVTDLTASATYKLLGEFDAVDGAGVLGRNTADSGTPIGVEGAVPNSSAGYGLSTPDDASVGGTAELAALAGALTGGQQVSDLLGSALTASSGTVTATRARIDVSDGSTTVSNVEAITFERGLSLTDDGDGTGTVDRT